ncbi:MAG: TonB-dependent receptor [Acidobacteriota bacterium]
MKKYFLLHILLAIGSASAAFSQSARDTAKTYYFDPVVVTGTNTDVLRSALPNSITVIGRQQIEESGETSLLSIINKRVPGVFVTERGVLGYGASDASAGSISIRGAGGSPNTEVLVMTDGRPQMMGLFGHPLPDTYVNADVERIEVIRGPASLVHGTNAMGGVINIITKPYRTPGLHYHADASHGSFSTETIDGGVSYGTEGASISLGGGHYQTEGHREHSSFRMNNGMVRTQSALGGEFFVSADATLTAYTAFDPGTIFAPAARHWVDIQRGSSGIALENRNPGLQGALKFFYNFGIHDIYDGFHSTDKNIGIVFYEGIRLGAQSEVTAGIDYNHYGGAAENRTARHSFGEYFTDEKAAYVLVQQTIAGRVTMNAGIRVNHHTTYGYETIPQIGAAFRIDTSLTLKASAGKGFRSPTIRELYLFPAPTPGLEPERMWNYEAGFLYHYRGIASAEVTAFTSEGSNMIRVGGMFPNLTLSNSGRFVHRGIEMSATVHPGGRLEIDLTYGYLDPGDQTMANPRHKLYAGASYAWETLRWNAGIQHVEKLYGADFGGRPLPDYTVVNSRLTWDVLPRVAVYLSADNLFNTGYTIMYGYPMPGRTVMGGISLRH